MWPTDAPNEFTVEQLAGIWEVERDRPMRKCEATDGGGARPWVWWWFDMARTSQTTIGPRRCGGLSSASSRRRTWRALRERANEAALRIGTDAELISGAWRGYGVSLDEGAVAPWEAVERAIVGSGMRQHPRPGDVHELRRQAGKPGAIVHVPESTPITIVVTHA